MKPELGTLIKRAAKAAKAKSPEILTAFGVCGMITTVVFAVKATPRAVRLIEQRKEEAHADELTAVETVKTTWKCYIPTAVMCAASCACIIGANSQSSKRNAAIAAAYSISETALREYKDKVKETIGVAEEKHITDEIAKDKLSRAPVEHSEIVVTGSDGCLCYDSLSGRYFRFDVESIRKAANEVNHRMLGEMCVSLNEFYYELGLDGIPVGETLGWHVDGGCFEVLFSSQIASDGTPCIVIDYSIPPKYGYDSLF